MFLVLTAGLATLAPQPASAFGGNSSKKLAALKASGAKMLPDGFIENKGQWDPQALFMAKGKGTDVWLTKTGVVYDFFRQETQRNARPSQLNLTKGWSRQGHVVRMDFLNTSSAASALGVLDQKRTLNFIGSSNRAASARSFNEASLQSLYPRVNLRVYRDNLAPRFDLNVAPGADVSQIKFKYDGATAIHQTANGSLVLGTSLGDQTVTDLHAYQQEKGSTKTVECSFVLGGDGTVGFKVGSYNKAEELVIDPVVYSTLLGAPFGTSQAFGVTVDQFGDAYVTGGTINPEFPTTAGAYNRQVASESAFVTEFLPDATGVIFSTLINNNPKSAALGAFIALDPQGRAVIEGVATSNYNVTSNAAQPAFGGGGQNAFVSVLSADGTQLDYSTYLGGNDLGFAGGLVVDSVGTMYAAGTTYAKNYPLTANAFQSNSTAGPSTLPGALTNGTFSVLNSNGAFVMSTYYGGTGNVAINGEAIDNNGSVYVCGGVFGTDFPTTINAFDKSPDNADGFVTKFGPFKVGQPMTLVYSSLLGGSGNDTCISIAVDNQDDAYVLGSTDSVDFPTTVGAFGRGSNGGNFVTKFSVDGSLLIYSTFLQNGGSIFALAVDDLGFAYITGSINLSITAMVFVNADPTNPGDPNANKPGQYAGPTNPLDPFGDVFLEVLNDSGTNEIFGSVYGGSEDDLGLAITVDPAHSAYIAGWTDSYSQGTTSYEFPTTAGAFITDHFGPELNPPADFPEGFLMKLKVLSIPILIGLNIAPSQVPGTQTAVGTVTLSQPASQGGGAAVELSSGNPNFARIADDNDNPLPGNILNIAPGQSTGTFHVDTSDTVQTNTVQIKAQYDGVVLVSTITIAPWLQSLTISPFTITGGNLATGRINLVANAPTSGITVNVTSSDPTKAFPVNVATGQAISNITIPSGQSSTSFNIATNGVDYPATVTFTARIVSPALSAVRTSNLTVVPAHLQIISFSPPVVNGGTPSIGTVLLDGKVGPTPVFVTLAKTAGGAPIILSKTSLEIDSGQSQSEFIASTGPVVVNDYATVTATRTSNKETAQGTLFIDQIAISGVALNTTSVLGGTIVDGHVVLSTPAAPGGLTVSVTSSNPTYGKLNTTLVTVPAGSIVSNDFQVATPVTTTDHTIQIIASKTGYASKSASLLERHLFFTLSAAPKTIIGGIQTIEGAIGLNLPAPTNPSGLSFSFKSSNPAVVQVPSATLTVPAGAVGSKPYIATSSVVSSVQTVTLTASIPALPNPITASQVITVKPLSLTLTINPTVVTGGVNAAGTITLSGASTSPVNVTLSSTNANAAAPSPGKVTIAGGSQTGTFSVVTHPVAADTQVTITGAVGGGGFNTATITVLAPRVIRLNVAQTVITGGLPTTGSVELNASGPAGGVNVPLTSNSAVVQVPKTVNVPAGSTIGSFGIGTSAVVNDTVVTLTATYPAGTTVTATITVQATRNGVLTISPNDVVGGASTTGTVSIDVAAPAGGLPVSLSLDSSSTGFAYVTIPASVTIPAGQKSAKFTIVTKPVSRTVGTTVTAAFGASGNHSSATLTIEPGN